MRVLHVIARLNVGGTARYLTQLVNELPKHGIQTFIATGFVQGSEAEDHSSQSIQILRIPALGRAINPFKDYKAYKQLEEIIAEVKPDVIHTHTFKAGYITRIKKRSVPLVHTFHGHLLADPEFSGLKLRIIILIEKILAKRTTKLVSVGTNVGADLVKSGIGVKNQFVSIPPGVIPLNITPRKEAQKNLLLSENNKPIIGWVARVTGVKNPLLALEVARVFPNVLFVMAGGGDLFQKVLEEAPANVRVVGWVKAEEVYGVSDVILSTSVNEGMPIALIEAQQAGLPVVATDVGSVSEVILNHETGIVTNANVGSIAAALNSVLIDSHKRNAMGVQAKSRALSLFSVDRMILAHVDLYKSIVK